MLDDQDFSEGAQNATEDLIRRAATQIMSLKRITIQINVLMRLNYQKSHFITHSIDVVSLGLNRRCDGV